jgi:hypothetical protein
MKILILCQYFSRHWTFCGNAGETDPLKGWRKLPNFAGEDFQFCADFML